MLVLVGSFVIGRRPGAALPFTIATTGLSAMLFELFLFFAFQVVYGCVFYQAGLLITAFMGGIAAGSLVAARRPLTARAQFRRLLLAEGGMVVLTLGLSLTFARLHAGAVAATASGHALFPALLVAAGFLTGLEFPLAAALHAARSGTPRERGAGIIFGADLAGAWFGGLIGGFILLPLAGLVASCLLIALLKTGSLLILARAGKRLLPSAP